jgi:hypothetical protein
MSTMRVAAFTLMWLIVLLGSIEASFRDGFPFRYPLLEPYYLLKSNDDWGHAGFELQKILQHHNQGDIRYVFLGGSAGLEAITTDEDILDRLADKGAPPVSFHSLVSSHKTFGDEAKLISALSKTSGLTLLIHTEAWRFQIPPQRQIEFTNASLAAGLVAKYYFLPVPPEIRPSLTKAAFQDVPFLRQYTLLGNMLPKIGELLKKRINLYPEHQKWLLYQHDRHKVSRSAVPRNSSQIEQINRRIREDSDYQENAEYNFSLLETTINIALEAGHHVILVEAPINEMMREEIEHWGDGYPERRDVLIASTGIEHIDFATGSVWHNELFRDHHHMLEAGRQRFTENLAEVLSARSELVR